MSSINHTIKDAIRIGKWWGFAEFDLARSSRWTCWQADRSRICRTFSDCTTAPRKGLVSGCYPLDEFYKSLPE